VEVKNGSWLENQKKVSSVINRFSDDGDTFNGSFGGNSIYENLTSLAESNILSALPISDPQNVGGLWNDLGTIKVSTQDVYYAEGTETVNVTDINSVLSGLNSGYIEFDLELRRELFDVDADNIEIFQSIGSTRLEINITSSESESNPSSNVNFLVITGNGGEGYSVDFNLLDIRTIRVYLGTGLDIEINRKKYKLGGGGGTSLEFQFPLDASELNFGIGGSFYDGLIYKRITINDGVSDILKWEPPHTSSQFTETVASKHGTYIKTSSNWPYPPIGYGSPTLLKNYYVAPIPEEDWFDDVSVNLNIAPTDAQIAYLRDNTTEEPYLPATFTEKDVSELERNPNCWYNTKAITCFSVMSEFHSFAAHVTMLSPRHAMIATHIWDDFAESEAKAKKYWFMDLAGNTEEHTTLDFESVGQDITVLLMDSTVALDVDYATFLLDTDINNYNFRESTGCAPSREGFFTIEKLAQLSYLGLPDIEEDQDEWLWSRWARAGFGSRVGDSSSPLFIYHGATLYFTNLAFIRTVYPWRPTGTCIGSTDGYNMISTKSALKTAMDALDDRNGGLPHYNLVESAI
jgi:hypothetical protein